MTNETLVPECSAVKAILEADNAIFGCKTEEDVMYKGGVKDGTFITRGVEECAMLCSGSPACQFWAFDGLQSCQLTSTEPLEKLSKPNAHSGSRLCGRFESFTQSQGEFGLCYKKEI